MPALTKAQTEKLEAARSEVSNLAERDAKVKGRDLFERIEKQTKVRGIDHAVAIDVCVALGGVRGILFTDLDGITGILICPPGDGKFVADSIDLRPAKDGLAVIICGKTDVEASLLSTVGIRAEA